MYYFAVKYRTQYMNVVSFESNSHISESIVIVVMCLRMCASSGMRMDKCCAMQLRYVVLENSAICELHRKNVARWCSEGAEYHRDPSCCSLFKTQWIHSRPRTYVSGILYESDRLFSKSSVIVQPKSVQALAMLRWMQWCLILCGQPTVQDRPFRFWHIEFSLGKNRKLSHADNKTADLELVVGHVTLVLYLCTQALVHLSTHVTVRVSLTRFLAQLLASFRGFADLAEDITCNLLRVLVNLTVNTLGKLWEYVESIYRWMIAGIHVVVTHKSRHSKVSSWTTRKLYEWLHKPSLSPLHEWRTSLKKYIAQWESTNLSIL